MNINGWLKNSFVDYPGKIATTVFVSGCNFLCPYCHNADLVLKKGELISYTEEEILEFLVKRNKMIDAICISGGEPTLYKDLPDFMKKIRELNQDTLIKLDTNGTNPELITYIIDNNLVDYIAMDIKAPLIKYGKVCGNEKINFENIEKSVNILKNAYNSNKIQCEFRTTVTRELLTKPDFVEIAKWIAGDVPYYLQQYVESEKQIKHGFSTYSKEDFEEISQIIKKYLKNIKIRNI